MSPPLLVSHYGLPRPSILNTVYVFTVYVFMMPVADTSNYALRLHADWQFYEPILDESSPPRIPLWFAKAFYSKHSVRIYSVRIYDASS